jgi:hypothetical protein
MADVCALGGTMGCGCKKEGQSDPLASIMLDRGFNDVT